MFQLQDPDDPPAEEPARRLLHMVLLMAARDRAKCLRLEPCEPDLRMFYCAPDNDEILKWFELVPAPVAIWEPIYAILRESGERTLPAPPPPFAEPAPRRQSSLFARWIGSRRSGRELEEYTGTLTHELGSYRCAWSFQLHRHRSRSDAILVPDLDAAHLPLAREWLDSIRKSDGKFDPPHPDNIRLG